MPPSACAKRSTKKWGSGANGKIGERERKKGRSQLPSGGREKMRKQRVEKKKKKSVPNVEVGSGRPPRDEGGNQGGGGVRGVEKHKNNLGHLKRFSCRPAVRKGNCGGERYRRGVALKSTAKDTLVLLVACLFPLLATLPYLI